MEPKELTPLGKLLTEKMEQDGISNREVDRRMGYDTFGWTSGVRTNARQATRGQLVRLADALDLDVDDVCFAAGKLAPDLEEALKTDRALVFLLRHALMTMTDPA